MRISNKRQTFFIIGQTTLAAQCAEFMINQGWLAVGLMTDDGWFKDWANQKNIPVFENFNDLPEFDYLFSIVNPKLVPDSLLKQAKILAINYHDSALPAYAGVHATSWAILNQEKTHGITWHVMAKKIDAGDILKQFVFPIDRDITALELNIQCYQEAFKTFQELFSEIRENRLEKIPQNSNMRSYFAAHRKPDRGGFLSWHSTAEENDALFRALQFGNQPNRFCLPKVWIKGNVLFPNGFEIIRSKSQSSPGTIISISETCLIVATPTRDVQLSFENEDLRKYQLEKGTCLELPSEATFKNLETFIEYISRFEKFWVNEFLHLEPLNLNLYSSSPLYRALVEEDQFCEVEASPNGNNPIVRGISQFVDMDLTDEFSQEAVLTSLLIYFYRLSNQNTFCISYCSNVAPLELEQFHNLFAEYLPFKINFDDQDSFGRAVDKVKAILHQLKEKNTYLKDIFMRYPDFQNSEVRMSEVMIQFVDDVEICSLPEGYSFGIYISYKCCRIIASANADFLANIPNRLYVLLQAGKSSKIAISQLPIVTPAEEQQIYTGWNCAQPIPPDCLYAHKSFEAHVSKHRDKIALVCDDASITYKELNDRSNRIAALLCNYGVGPEVNVVLYADKSLELIVAILGVLKTGGTFVPLEPANYPKERLEYILEEIEPRVILTQSHLTDHFKVNKNSLVCIDKIDDVPVLPLSVVFSSNTRAYIIYTSGSTGKPKGVEVEHKQLMYALKAKEIHYQLQDVKSLWMSSISFDISIAIILYPLVTGGTLYLSSSIPNTDSDGIIKLLNHHKINHFNCATSLYAMLLGQNKRFSCPTLQLSSIGGEALSESLLTLHKQYFPHAALNNEYGPSECTVWCSYAKIYDPKNRIQIPISIGRPIQHARMYILDKHLQTLPIGTTGEIYVGGEGVTRGYYNNPELTAAKFLTTSKLGRLYKTGDLGCFLSDGNIQFCGRADNQVKFRGYRIELEEIEKALCEQKEIFQSVVTIKQMDERITYLIAYVVLNKEPIDFSIDRCLLQLAMQLPEYMLPNSIVVLEKFPLTNNGKIDRKKLPPPNVVRHCHAIGLQSPKTEMESLVAKIWSDLLNIDCIGLTDNFFTLGGHSLLAVQGIVKLQNALKIEIPLKTFYEYSTLESFSRALEMLKISQATQQEVSYPEIVIEPSRRHEEFPLTDIQQAYWIGRNEMFALSQVAVHGYNEYECLEIDLELLEKSWNALIQRHEALRLVFPGDGTQKILAEVPHYHIYCYDTSDKEEAFIQKHLSDIRSRLSHQVLPANIWPLFEICVTKMADCYRIHFSIDGLILDGWSLNILFNEWAILYKNPKTILPTLEVSFRDYVLADMQLKNSSIYNRDKAYWVTRLAEFPMGPPLPRAKEPRQLEKQNFIRCSKELPKDLWNVIKDQLHLHNLTPTSFLLGIFAEILQNWSNSDHFTVTLTLFNRLPLHHQINAIMGDFTSLTLCEIDLRKKSSFKERMHALQNRLFTDIDHRLFSGIEVLREIGRKNQSSWDMPSMPIVFTSLLAEESQEHFPEFTLNQVFSITQTPQVWLDYKAYTQQGNLVLEWDYVEGLFPENLISSMHDANFNLLKLFAKSLDAWNQQSFNLLPTIQQACRDIVNNTSAISESILLHQLFQRQAQKTPSQPAIIFDDRTLSYGEILARANQLGRYLRNHGATRNRLIAIVMEKSPDQILACLGVLFSGSAYLPINADYPLERINELIELGEVDFMITQEKYFSVIESLPYVEKKSTSCVVIDGQLANIWQKESSEDLESVQIENDLAYVIFTSGSTGSPKGVMIDHRGVVNTILDINQRYDINSQDRILALSHLTFDLSVYDIFGLLAAGGTIVLPQSVEIKEPERWIDLVNTYKVTLWNTVPMFMSMFVEYLRSKDTIKSAANTLRLVLLSGDWIPLELPDEIKRIFGNPKIISLGGATEASIWSIAYTIDNVHPYWNSIPYGFPLRNQEIYVLNDHLQICPDWVTGHLYIGGIGIAKGYWKDKKRTDAQFIYHPQFQKMLYKTGDLGRYYPDGNIEFIGRSDNQVKVNGFRVELGEIQHTLETHEQTSKALVAAIGDKEKEKRLVAYIILKEDEKSKPLEGVEIEDSAERLNFKLTQINFRNFHPSTKGYKLNIDDNSTPELFFRKSYRCYDGETIPGSLLIEVLKKCYLLPLSKQENTSITATQLESLLKPLAAFTIAGQPLFKYHYPSAGSLYPIQTYVKVNNIQNIEQGLYYFHPNEKRLWKVEDELESDEECKSDLAIYFIANPEAIKPLYGTLWKEFCELEMGYMSSLILDAFHSQNRHVSKRIPATEIPKVIFEAKPSESASSNIEIILYAKPEALAGLDGGWYCYNPKLEQLYLISNEVPFSPNFAENDYYSILSQSSFGLFFIADSNTTESRMEAGILAQRIMEQSSQSLIGFCPIGTLDSACHSQVNQVIGNKFLLHLLVGGPITQVQLFEKHSSIPKSSEKLIHEIFHQFLKEKLPDYFIPSYYIFLKRFPLSANGKIDIKSLPQPQITEVSAKYYVPPRTDIEKKLAEIWSEVLNIDRIGIHDSFFGLGGHSLSAVKVITRIRKRFNVDIVIKKIFEYPTIESLAAHIAVEAEKVHLFEYPVITKVIGAELLPLSFAQQRLWFLDQLLDNKVVYNIPLAFKLKGDLRIDILKESLSLICKKHEILRTVFHANEGNPYQVILDVESFDLPLFYHVDFSHHLEEESNTPFNLSNSPLFRGRLIQLADEEHVLILTLHHIVTDEWSIQILLKDLSAFYNAISKNLNFKPEHNHIQYSDFAIWQRRFHGNIIERQFNFWRQFLENAPELLQLPTDKLRPKKQSYRGATYRHHIDLQLVDDLKKFGDQYKATLFMVLIGAFQTLLYRYSNQKCIVTGFPVANRHYPGVENLMGFFANTVALKSDFEIGMSFIDLLLKIKQTSAEVYENQDVPFEYLVDALKIPRDLSRHPLFQVMFVYRNFHQAYLDLQELQIESIPVEYRESKFDLSLIAQETSTGIALEFEYATDLFEACTIVRIATNFITLLESIVKTPSKPVELLEIIGKDESKTIMHEWNATSKNIVDNLCLHQLFERHARTNPHHPALIFENNILTYDEMNKKANQLAHHLRELHVGSDTIVGLCCERSLDLVICIYAIVKAGGAYLPFDSSLPKERIHYMLENANVKIILTHYHHASNFSDFSGKIITIDKLMLVGSEDNLSIDYPRSSLAYVIYTSGSTGQPKGVCLEHQGLINRILWMQDEYPLCSHDRVLQKTPYSFDVSVWEFFWPLSVGATLVVSPPGIHRQTEEMISTIQKQQISCMHLVPSMLGSFLEFQGPKRCPKLRLVFSSGEALSKNMVEQFFEQTTAELHNLYGPTEASIDVTYWNCSKPTKTSSIPIGKPIWNTQTYILDEYHHPVPIGVTGELYLAGVGLARGYLNNPVLTSERFLYTSIFPDTRLYKTGDLARYLPDGNIEFLGRIDHQIKIRGYRIELGEIEMTLESHPEIQKCIVNVHLENSGSKSLIAYIILKSSIDTDLLRYFLMEKLPEYMVPAQFICLEAFPYTTSGKVDRKALIQWKSIQQEKRQLQPPRNQVESELMEIWEKVLNRDSLGINDNFFELGGDSILSLRIVALAKNKGLHFHLADIFNFPTIAELSAKIKRQSTNETMISLQKFSLLSQEDKQKLPKNIEDAYPLASLQAGMIYYNELHRQEAMYQDIFSYEIEGILVEENLRKILESMLMTHAVLRTSFDYESYSEPLQLVHATSIVGITFIDSSNFDKNQALNLWFENEKHKGFDISSSSLIRFTVHKWSENNFQLGFTFHHAILDGWSIATMVADILYAYSQTFDKKLINFKQPKLGYNVFIKHEREIINSQIQADFWKEQLVNFQQLKIDHELLPVPVHEAEGIENIVIDPATVTSLTALAKRLNVSIKNVLLAAHIRVLACISGQSDVTTGYISNGRPEELDSENTLGLFLNTIPLRLILKAGTWEDLVLAIHQKELELLPYRRYPLAKIQEHLHGAELLNTSFNYVNFHVYQKLMDSKHVKLVKSRFHEKTNFILSSNFYVDISSGKHYLSLEYDPRKVSKERITSISIYFQNALESLAFRSKTLYHHDSLLSKSEINKQLYIWNSAIELLENPNSVITLFNNMVENHPTQPAVIFQNQTISYQDLHQKALHISLILKSLNNKNIVAIAAEPSIIMVATLLGVHMAGACFVALDPNQPSERLNYILQDSKASVLLTQKFFFNQFEFFQGQIIDIESHYDCDKNTLMNDVAILPSSAAYLLYTSGSTGYPKGVLVDHPALVNQIQWLQHTYTLNSTDVLLHHTSVSFDVFIEEIFWPLCSGATLVIAPKNIHTSIEKFLDLIAESKITIVDLVPSLLDVILQHDNLQRLQTVRQVFVGGESLHFNTVKQFYSKLKSSLVNMYGLTETTITSTYYPCTPISGIDSHRYVPIGRPISNTKIYIFDSNLCLVPAGVPGEIYIGGKGLARGYFNNLDLTNDHFIANPYDPQEKLFKTGDIGRYGNDGAIEFLGRADQQVKIRGQRFELEGIEDTLKRNSSVSQAVIALQQDPNQEHYLVAYVVLAAHSEKIEQDLKNWLRQWFPENAIPSKFMFIDEFPYLPNGKIDRRSLPKLEQYNKEYMPPTTETERILASIWCDILHIKQVSIDENFFALGGNSLSMTIVAMHVRKKFNKEISLHFFLENSTIAHLARLLDEKKMEIPKISTFEFPKGIKLDPEILPPSRNYISGQFNHILLTGVTGFLGAHLFVDLLQCSNAKIYCLIRAKNQEEANQRLMQSIHRYFPNMSIPIERVIVLCGDFSKPLLGLNQDIFLHLAEHLEVILHNGAYVHHIFDYQTLMGPNVSSVIEMLKLATTGNIKQVIYVSTLSIAESENNWISEKFIVKPYLEGSKGGYEQSKWIAEKILTEAFQRGIPVRIFRPSTIIGNSLTGISSFENDHLLRLLKGCIQLKKAPDWDLVLDMLPVDFVSTAIVKIALFSPNSGNVFNLSNPHKFTWLDLINQLQSFGYDIEIIPHKDWKVALTEIQQDNALYSLLSLYLGEEHLEETNKIVNGNTTTALQELGIQIPQIDPNLLKTKFQYLSKAFF